MRKRKIGLILIVILVFIVGAFILIKSMRSKDKNIEEIKVAIDSTEEETAGHLSTSMEFTPKMDDTGKQNLKYQWELINTTEERLSDGGKWSKKVVNDGGESIFTNDNSWV